MKKIKLTFCFILLLNTMAYGAVVNDTPHNESNGIVCKDCHTYSLWWKYSPAANTLSSDSYTGVVEDICLKCHDGSKADVPMVKGHSSMSMEGLHDTSLGVWGRACTDCHDPHFQKQLDWSSTLAANLYLVTGNIKINSIQVSGDGSLASPYVTKMGYENIAPGLNSSWDGVTNWADNPASWSAKNGVDGRGLILALPLSSPKASFEVQSVDTVWHDIIVSGKVDSSFGASGENFGLMYGQLLKNNVNGHPVKLFNPKISFDSGVVGGYADANNREGLCQVCHEHTPYWTSDGECHDATGNIITCEQDGVAYAPEGHNSDNTCTNCHIHSRGFAPGSDSGKHKEHLDLGYSCVACHGENGLNSIPPKFADGQDFDNTTSCADCHNDGKWTYDAQGQPIAPGPPNKTDYKANWENENYYFGCFGCHNGSPTLASDVGSAECDDARQCKDCHGGVKTANVSICVGDDCSTCHDGTGNITNLPVSDDLQRKPVGMETAGHKRLVSTQWIRMFPCYYCHSDTVDINGALISGGKHLNSIDLVSRVQNDQSVDVVINSKWDIPTKPEPYYTDHNHPADVANGEEDGSCYNTYCHTDGTTVNPVMKSYAWTGGSKECNGCHGHDEGACNTCHEQKAWAPEDRWLSAMPMYKNYDANGNPLVGTDGANSHFRHLFSGFSCDDCHADTVVGACLDCHGSETPTGTMSEAQHVNADKHVNKQKTIVFKNGGTYDPRNGYKTCSNTVCHTGYAPQWGGSVLDSVTCKACHGIDGDDIDDFAKFNGIRAKINLTEWATTGHGRPTSAGPYGSGNPAANFPENGCWYCHDNTILHNDEDRPFRLRQHDQFNRRFEKECIFCHMSGEDTECLGCHNDPESLAPQLADTPALPGTINSPYTIERPDHTTINSGCSASTCHVDDHHRHNTDAGTWTEDQKEDVKNSYLQVGVCLKCHDDDSTGECTSCHTGAQYALGYDPELPGTYFIKPQQAKASSFHFGHKHYSDYVGSLSIEPDNGTVSDAGTTNTELQDTTKDWPINQWYGYYVQMVDGPDIGESRMIVSNTKDTLTLESGFTVPVQSNNIYKILVETGVVSTSSETLIDSGTVSENAASDLELTDSTKLWSRNGLKHYSIRMLDGPDSGEVRRIASNTSTTITLISSFSNLVLAGNGYEIVNPELKDTTKHWQDNQWKGYSIIITGGPIFESGTVSETATDNSLLKEDGKAWNIDQWKGYSVRMTAGTNIDEVREISSNTADTLTLVAGFVSPVELGDNYEIIKTEVKRVAGNTSDTVVVNTPFSRILDTSDTYKIVMPVWKGGKFCWDCHDPHGDNNLDMIQNKVATRTDGYLGRPIYRSTVNFTDKNNLGLSYARIDPPYDGICNVCHADDNQHYGANHGDGHNSGRRCTECHEHRFTDSHSDGQTCNSCHRNRPVPRHTAFGQPRDCTKCHSGVIQGRMNIMGQFNANSHHIQGVPVTNKQCYNCHWEATELGLINIEHHQGYNYKKFTGESGREVDLVIWNDTTRPTTYTEGVTATKFLASDMANPGSTVERAAVESITPHCLGCHSDLNKDTSPFGDCKTPRQYAWDGSSIASRYLDTGTTTWGKYPTVANAAQKNITKAFSAHGNAVNNQGGFDPATGTDEAIANSRAGNRNIQCFDCHNSHGSTVGGITSSYYSFRGDRNGANLKETVAGKGGYSMTYFASANLNPAAVNPYEAGAGQCFDCHETATSGVTPWGYNSTFGESKPIMGYSDSPKFGLGTRGMDIRYPYKNIPIMGGHFKATSTLETTPLGQINGLCTACHDPHGVSQSLGADRAYAVPMLKGTWMTSPYKEDVPPDDVSTGRRLNKDDPPIQYFYSKDEIDPAPTPVPYVHTDQATFGPTDRIKETADKFAGLCLRCHPKDSLTDGINNNGAWKSKDRVHESVRGWGDNEMHSYSCSKCHVPHSSPLPRLMQTNCLDTNHRGRVASGGVAGSSESAWGSFNPRYPYYYPASFPKGRAAVAGDETDFKTNCHPTGTWPDNTWNEVSPW